MSLVGNGFTTSDAKTGQRLQVNVVVNGGDDLNFTAATCGDGADTGFCFFNCGEGKGSITLSRPGYQARIIDAVFPIATNIDYALEPTPLPALGPLTFEGQFFRQNGQRMTIIESSDFSLFKRYLEREKIYDVVAQRRDLGFNMLRVWLLNTSVVEGGIWPSKYSDFYKHLGEFAAYVKFCGLNLDITVFTQTKTLMPDKGDQQRHMDASAAALDGLGTVILSRVNEADQHDNATADGLVRPLGGIYSHGSNGADAIPPSLNPATTDAVEYHANDLDQWQRKTGHNAMEWADMAKVPGWTSEATRSPDSDSNEAHYEDAAAGAALLCAGSCFHSVNGKASKLFEGDELKCAQAHVRGAKSVPLEFQAGAYVHHSELEGPKCIRAYGRRLSDSREHIVRIRP